MAAGDSGCEAYTAIAWGVGLSHERSDIAGAEGFHSLEGNMCGTVMRGADALPGSKATSRAKGSHRNLGDLVSGRRRRVLCVYGGPHREGEEPKPMMHGHEKSDPAIVALKPANKAEQPTVEASAGASAAEPVEPRAWTKGNADQHSTCRAQNRVSVEQALERIRKVARERKKERFTALFHHISIELLEQSFFELEENAAPGVDRLTWTDYEADLECQFEDLHDRVQRGAYRPLPSRRVYIPKPDGRQRPLAVAALEDRIVQRAVVTLLNAIYEEDFLGISYGFRAAAPVVAVPAAARGTRAEPTMQPAPLSAGDRRALTGCPSPRLSAAFAFDGTIADRAVQIRNPPGSDQSRAGHFQRVGLSSAYRVRRALAYFASGSGRSWNFTSLGTLPLPMPSSWNGVRLPVVAQMPRPFQPALASSMRPSMVLA